MGPLINKVNAPFQKREQTMVSIYYAGKLLIQLLLFAIFLLFFGLPSYHRYHQKGVLVNP